MKIWVDDIRPAPDGYMWCKSVNTAMARIWYLEVLCVISKRQNEISN